VQIIPSVDCQQSLQPLCKTFVADLTWRQMNREGRLTCRGRVKTQCFWWYQAEPVNYAMRFSGPVMPLTARRVRHGVGPRCICQPDPRPGRWRMVAFGRSIILNGYFENNSNQITVLVKSEYSCASESFERGCAKSQELHPRGTSDGPDQCRSKLSFRKLSNPISIPRSMQRPSTFAVI